NDQGFVELLLPRNLSFSFAIGQRGVFAFCPLPFAPSPLWQSYPARFFINLEATLRVTLRGAIQLLRTRSLLPSPVTLILFPLSKSSSAARAHSAALMTERNLVSSYFTPATA